MRYVASTCVHVRRRCPPPSIFADVSNPCEGGLPHSLIGCSQPPPTEGEPAHVNSPHSPNASPLLSMLKMRTWIALFSFAVALIVGAGFGQASTSTCDSNCARTCCRRCDCVESDKCLLGCKAECCTTTQVTISGIDTMLLIDAKGRQVAVTGPFECSAGGLIELLRVTVSQRVSGAVAEGETRGTCSGRTENSPSMRSHGAWPPSSRDPRRSVHWFSSGCTARSSAAET